MPLGTLDRTPPPIFHQGLSARTKLVFFAALALFLMVADARFQWAKPIRESIAIVLAPVQRALLVPVSFLSGTAGYAQGLQTALSEREAAQKALAAQAERAARADRLQMENAQLRALLEMKPALAVRSQAAQVLFEATDPFSRKVVLDIGAAAGVQPGAPVINHLGVLGQVTRVYALTSEVTLLADRDAAIVVLNTRTQQRAAAYGGVQGAAAAGGARMELRFSLPTSDLLVGDVFVTSGLDGVFPAALPVATVSQVDKRGEGGFARVLLVPAAPPDAVRHVLVLEPTGLQMPPRPAAPAPAAAPSPAGKAAASPASKAVPAAGGGAP